MSIVRRIVVIAAALALMLAVAAGPASAHFNEAAGKAVGPPNQEHIVEAGGLGHIGMECGARDNTPLDPLGLPCPATR
jgi:hypothetical protein